MSVEKLTNTLIKNYPHMEKRYTVRDSGLRGLVLRVEPRPSSKKTFYLDYREKSTSKRSSLKIGDAGVLTVSQAREIAQAKLTDLIKGVSVKAERSPSEPTVKEIFELYKKQVLEHHRSKSAESFIERDFQKFFSRVCSTLTVEDLATWRSEEKKRGKKASSMNRASSAFLAMLRWGRENDKIGTCPLIQKKIKRLPESDSNEIIRYLSPDERRRLLAVLDRREKNGEPDYLKTIVLAALNTGIRRGALLKLTWDDINFEIRAIRLRRETAKGDKQSYIPMNETVFKLLSDWKSFQRSTATKNFLFIGPTGAPMHDVRSSWKKVLSDAGIEGFRWHDLRHDFASQLVMAGASILTVKELLTHTKIEQTLRYAHLAPDQKKDAVDRLDSLYK